MGFGDSFRGRCKLEIFVVGSKLMGNGWSFVRRDAFSSWVWVWV